MNDVDRPIIITGCARSGEPIIAQVLQASGCFMGPISRKTHYRNMSISHEIIQPYLHRCHADETGQNPLPPKDVDHDFPALHDRALRIMVSQGYKGGVWGMQDHRLMLMWKAINDAFPKARWIIVKRDTHGIANSCARTAYMDAFRTRDMWTTWAEEMLMRIEFMCQELEDVTEVWPSNLIEGDISEMEQLCDKLGLKLDKKVAASFQNKALDLRRV